MRLTTRARYALRLMLDVANNGGDEHPVSLASVSERTGISRGYLEQLALGLRNARLVRGVAGRYGGYRLTEIPSNITVGQIVESAIGPICLVDCLEDPMTCPRADFCECRIVYELINDRISEVLNEYTLADLLDPSWIRNHNTPGKNLLLNPESLPQATPEVSDVSPVVKKRPTGAVERD